MATKIKLVVFDWAGTVIDHGCFAPVAAFQKVFSAHGVEATLEQAREPMGLEKREHIRAMLQEIHLARAWLKVHGREWNEADVDALYAEFVPLQLAAIEEHADLIPGALAAQAFLKRHGIKTAGTTGYFEAAARRVEALAAQQGFKVDANAWAMPGQSGRPAPWMIFKNMEALGIFPPESVLKIGDTIHDIAEGNNAGAVSAAVLRGSSDMGLSRSAYDELADDDRTARLASVARSMRLAGAQGIITSLLDLPELIDAVEANA